MLAAGIDYLVIGHVTRDRIPGGTQAGGTATYSSRMAHALGCRTAVLTSTRPDYDLGDLFTGIDLAVVPAAEDTIFENVYQGNQRSQWLRGRAVDLIAGHVPAGWEQAGIVHLGPVANEIDPLIVNHFPNSFIGLTPQGWMRRTDGDGRVRAVEFDAEEYLLRRARAVVISEEDLLDEAMLARYIRWAPLLVMTQNYAGCTIFMDGQIRPIAAPRIDLVEPTGAGDIFAAAFFVRLWRNQGDPIDAAEFANQVAAHSVTRARLEDKVIAWEQAVG